MKNILIIIICLMISGRAKSAPPDAASDPDSLINRQQPLLLNQDALEVKEQPKFSIHNALYLSATTTLAVGLVHFDQQTFTLLYRWKQQSPFLRKASPAMTTLGDGKFSFGLFGAYVAYGELFSDNGAMQVGKIGLESFAASGVAVQLLKFIFAREEPGVATVSRGRWNGPFSYFRRNRMRGKGFESFDSFPSGHTATIFAAATTLSDYYHESWVTGLSYSIASGVAISRVMEKTHWVSDCFVGALIGIYSTKLVEQLNLRSSSLDIQPTKIQHAYGLKFDLFI